MTVTIAFSAHASRRSQKQIQGNRNTHSQSRSRIPNWKVLCLHWPSKGFSFSGRCQMQQINLFVSPAGSSQHFSLVSPLLDCNRIEKRGDEQNLCCAAAFFFFFLSSTLFVQNQVLKSTIIMVEMLLMMIILMILSFWWQKLPKIIQILNSGRNGPIFGIIAWWKRTKQPTFGQSPKVNVLFLLMSSLAG